MRVVLGFFRGMGTLARPWHAWLALLTLVNGIAPLIFLGSLEARVVLISFLIACALELAMFARLGFVRLLGAVHLVVWIPMLIWLWPRAALAGTGSLYGRWLAAVVLLDLLSLLIDVTDVVRYLLGDREPTLKLEESP